VDTTPEEVRMPTCAEVAPISAALSVLIADAPVHAGALTVVPLLAPAGPEPDWLTLAESGDRVTITEVDDAGSVPTLQLVNQADRPVLLLDGEELVGAKQNRILNTTVLVAAGAKVTIPVSCVEQGRWAWRSRHFTSGGVSLYASARRKKSARVTESLRASGEHRADQGEVWEDVAQRAMLFRVESPTGAMRDVYERHERDVAAAREALAARPQQVGAIVWIAGTWVGMELLAGPGLFARAWPRLASGYVADAIGREAKAFVPDAAEVRRAILRTPAEPAPAVALGVEQRLAGKRVVGAALVVDERVAHLMVFPGPV
jgi:hypothetical protein